MIDNALIESITQISNHPKVIGVLESQVAFPQKIQEWQTKRVLYSLLLFTKVYEKEKDEKLAT